MAKKLKTKRDHDRLKETICFDANSDIPEFDAFSLAWSGLTYTGAYANAASFEIGGTTYSKADIIQASAKYMGGADGNLLDGTELCDN